MKALAQWGKLTSSEHFSVDGTLIEAWASHKSFKPKDGSGPPTGPGRNPEVDFKGQRRINDTHDFVAGCRKAGVTPHVAAKRTGSALDGRTTRHAGYKTSLKVRKRIEEAFGWLKTVGGLRKTKLIGREKLAGQALLCFATYNLVRIGSLTGWWDAKHV